MQWSSNTWSPDKQGFDTTNFFYWSQQIRKPINGLDLNWWAVKVHFDAQTDPLQQTWENTVQILIRLLPKIWSGSQVHLKTLKLYNIQSILSYIY